MSDLTRRMDEQHNGERVAVVEAPGSVPSQLPSGWVPDDVVVRAWARRNAGYGWETLIPEFSIAGMGGSLDAAIENAVELLDDYLLLCSRDGMSFAEARRPLPTRDMARLLGEFTVGRVVGKLSFGNSGRKRLDLPLHHALTAH
jgi:hypothetical protein